MTESRWPESTAGCETLKQPRGIEVRPGLVGFVARELFVERDQEVRQFAANRSRPKPRRQGWTDSPASLRTRAIAQGERLRRAVGSGWHGGAETDRGAPFDLLLLDVTMPGPNGQRVLEAVRREA